MNLGICLHKPPVDPQHVLASQKRTPDKAKTFCRSF